MWPISKQRGLAFHPASSFFTFTLELNLLMLIVAAVLTGLNNPVFAIPFSSQASRFQDLGNSTRNIPLISSRVDHVSLIRHARNLSSMKFFAGTNRLQSGHLDIFANKDDANIPACDVSVVLSYRERIDPVDKILQTRLDQKDVCHFHLVIILWDVPWANHHQTPLRQAYPETPFPFEYRSASLVSGFRVILSPIRCCFGQYEPCFGRESCIATHEAFSIP
eukprot:m.65670 g.65670  ORF g.65670 m.65670 type:complete len:221 (-) comp13552_c0_seq3:1811-2473(-)